MRKILRVSFVLALVLSGGVAGTAIARADADCDGCTNQQDGDNAGSTNSAGSSNSGDAVGGQVAGVVSSGDASVDAKNRSEKVDVESGRAIGSNTSASFVGLNDSSATAVTGFPLAADATAASAVNQQDGDNEFSQDQTADASSGDAVGGQIIGVVTSAGGSADVVADNASKKVDAETGEAGAFTISGSFVGLNGNAQGTAIVGTDVTSFDFVVNQQEGDNTLDKEQSLTADSGDGVAGQVIGVVSAGDASIDAKNRSEKVDVETGGLFGGNASAAFVGLNTSTATGVFFVDASASFAFNQQDGDNETDIVQTADAESGDGVGGQVIGAVTSAGGSADIVADNASKKVDIETGGAFAVQIAASFVGLNFSRGFDGLFISTSDADAFSAVNQQDGDNTFGLDQTASAATGDGVGGQVLGVVSAGDASIDAKNRSEKVDLETGGAGAGSEAAAFVGLNVSTSTTVETDDADADFTVNQQEGDNDAGVSQTADASSGDAVGGQVAGVVTSAGGSADLVLDNASKKINAETGFSDFFNIEELFAGLNFNTDTLFLGPD